MIEAITAPIIDRTYAMISPSRVEMYDQAKAAALMVIGSTTARARTVEVTSFR